MRCLKKSVAMLGMVLLLAASSAVPAADEPDSGALAAALIRAQENPHINLELLVDCVNVAGKRVLRLYPSGAAFWNNEIQIPLGEDTRQSLLRALQDADFASFEAHYGGKAVPRKAEAALRVMCRINVIADGVRKNTLQEVHGERSKPFLELADRLLDLAEPLATEGVLVENLADGLAKLAEGRLAAEALDLRYVHLPESTDTDGGSGHLLQIEHAQFAQRRYRPGTELEPAEPMPLSAGTLAEVVDALRKTEFWSLPVNIRAKELHQFSVRVLQHNHEVIARPFTRVAAAPGAEKRVAILSNALLSLRFDREEVAGLVSAPE